MAHELGVRLAGISVALRSNRNDEIIFCGPALSTTFGLILRQLFLLGWAHSTRFFGNQERSFWT
jgi:hypothetical protein